MSYRSRAWSQKTKLLLNREIPSIMTTASVNQHSATPFRECATQPVVSLRLRDNNHLLLSQSDSRYTLTISFPFFTSSSNVTVLCVGTFVTLDQFGMSEWGTLSCTSVTGRVYTVKTNEHFDACYPNSCDASNWSAATWNDFNGITDSGVECNSEWLDAVEAAAGSSAGKASGMLAIAATAAAAALFFF